MCIKYLFSISNHKQVLIFFICLLCTLGSQTFAQTILYPGTFDPFHSDHYTELTQAVQEISAKNAVILPIEDSYYSSGYPQIFPFNFRKKLISQTFSENPNITGVCMSMSYLRTKNVLAPVLSHQIADMILDSILLKA